MKSIHFYLIASFFVVFIISCEENKKTEVIETKQNFSETKVLDSLITAYPNNSELFYKRSRYYFDKQSFPKALIDVLYAIKLNNKNIAAYLLCGDIYLAMSQGQDAVDLMSEAININPGNEVLYERAVEYNFYMKNNQSAINFANDLLKINKNNANAYFFKGLIHKETNIDKAISNFQTTVEQDPTYYNAYMQLASLFAAKNDKIALQYYDNALRLNPSSREAIYGKGFFLQERKQFNSAKSEYKKLIIADRKDYQAIFNMGHCFLAQDSILKAQKHFKMASKIEPDNVDVIFMQGQIFERIGDIKNAKIQYNIALKMLPGNETIIESLEEIKAKEK